ncbi:hypothetical protein MNBD_NITROSPINAE05-172 [hydrothermal vent metagenome]|uniref:Lipoprotein n=1 Tax=hydrothermal vent metagenome TaxID=652676 RepID=A0A3B1DJ65_9ZZZZ
MIGILKTGFTVIFAGLFMVGCATTDPCVNILQEKPMAPGIKMNSVNIIDTSLYYEMVGGTYCNGVRVAPTTEEVNSGVVTRYKISVQQTQSDRTNTGTMQVWTILRNHTNFPLQIEGRTQFFDQLKTPIEEMTAWKRIQLPPKSIGTYKVQSTRKDEGMQFYIEIREGR